MSTREQTQQIFSIPVADDRTLMRSFKTITPEIEALEVVSSLAGKLVQAVYFALRAAKSEMIQEFQRRSNLPSGSGAVVKRHDDSIAQHLMGGGYRIVRYSLGQAVAEEFNEADFAMLVAILCSAGLIHINTGSTPLNRAFMEMTFPLAENGGLSEELLAQSSSGTLTPH